MSKTSPLEDNWELAMSLKEIIIENSERWKVFQKEKDEIRDKKAQKERRFDIIREKKRKWEGRKEDENTPNETYKKEIKEIEHYEMWYNIWERRRGQRSTMERNIEEMERNKRKIRWEAGNMNMGKGTTQEVRTPQGSRKEKDKGRGKGKY